MYENDQITQLVADALSHPHFDHLACFMRELAQAKGPERALNLIADQLDQLTKSLCDELADQTCYDPTYFAYILATASIATSAIRRANHTELVKKLWHPAKDNNEENPDANNR